jgi:acetyl-CoA C-acetyltransferase
MKDVFIVDGARSPIGRVSRSLKSVSAINLAAVLIKFLVKKNKLNRTGIDEVILGNVVAAGLGQNIARQALIQGGLSPEVPGFTVNKVCGSGLKSVILAAQAIISESSGLIVAGGTESASQSPYILSRVKKSTEFTVNDLKDSLIQDGLWCNLSPGHMGELAEYTAEKFKISRQEQDEYALASYQKSFLAQRAGLIQKEIVPIKINEKKIISSDDRLKKSITRETLSSLPSAFKAQGTVTAGNSSAPADGSAVLVISSKAGLKKQRLKPLARILGYSSVAVEPKLVFTAAGLAINKCLKVSGLKKSKVDLFEVNEAFAVQALLTARTVGIDPQALNILGGTLALGHPLGASGARGLVTLLNALKTKNKKIGLTSVCLGGGGALAMAVEKV